ncbi:sigma factor [Kitasatospora phosalacinea]|uniref:Uncharacterized protein n=1 Tax=Kitasatospora phosalacinea TaxID=2065 RepID=A0A9W6PCH0_9ACTN|nr:sigma factor [Kitasatospora phosalacinea]GLW53285.1 hypothetical protein Kpho01_12960 [Kitasatospora phosalacinea]
MTTLVFTGLLDSIHHRVLHPDPDRRLRLEVSGPAGGRLLLDPLAARDLAYRSAPEEGREVWAGAIRLAQRSQRPEGEWSTYLVWLFSPVLRRTVRKVSGRLAADRRDVEAEAVAGLLDAVPDADPDHPEASRWLLRRAARRAWDAARTAWPERPDQAAAAIADRQTLRDGTPAQAQPWEPDWELAISPPARPDGLAAQLRFTVSPTVREGERLGALAERMGLAEVVRQARRPRGPVVGTLSLRPAGATR